jgi:hypothetical protein
VSEQRSAQVFFYDKEGIVARMPSFRYNRKISIKYTCMCVIIIYLKCKTNKLPILIFDASDAHFDYSSLFSDAQVKKVGNPKKNVKIERTIG